MTSISKRNLNIGIASAIGLIVLYIIKGIYSMIGIENIEFFYLKQSIVVVAHFWCYISILFILKNILVDYYGLEQFRNTLKWLIRLEVLGGLFSILTSFSNHYGIVGVLFIVIAVFIIFFIRFLIAIYKLDEDEVPIIKHLHNFVIAILIMIILAIFLSAYVEIRQVYKLKFIIDFLPGFPMLFIALFFKQFKQGEMVKENNNLL